MPAASAMSASETPLRRSVVSSSTVVPRSAASSWVRSARSACRTSRLAERSTIRARISSARSWVMTPSSTLDCSRSSKRCMRSVGVGEESWVSTVSVCALTAVVRVMPAPRATEVANATAVNMVRIVSMYPYCCSKVSANPQQDKKPVRTGIHRETCSGAACQRSVRSAGFGTRCAPTELVSAAC